MIKINQTNTIKNHIISFEQSNNFSIKIYTNRFIFV
jgi:hypothetical protein